MEVQILVLKAEYKKAIKDNKFLKKQLASFNGVSDWTVDRWRHSDDPMLTTATNLNIIRTFLHLPKTVELTEPFTGELEDEEEEGHGAVLEKVKLQS